ncbi:probable cytochrome P450 6a20 [Agrilus planipennis]|uniref:Probable cytochrome P450 6a20 n=1 Tax=Agrilus planipennis TaxID=224129 RepID=A0A1W4WG78_AGRPL|nr:probable cytochrome P450 6a20 [Agrilus planipennis]
MVLETLLMSSSVLLVILAVCVVLYYKWCFTYWKRKNVFTLPPSIPFGNAKENFYRQVSFAHSIIRLYRIIKSKGLQYGGYYMLWKPIFIPVDPNLIKLILNKDFDHFTNTVNYSNEKTDPLSGNLFFLKGDKWRLIRSKLSSTFTSGKNKSMLNTMVKCTEHMPNILDRANEQGEAIEVKEFYARFTTDLIGACALGVNCSALLDENSPYRDHGRRIFDIRPNQTIKSLLYMAMPNVLKFFNVSINRKDVESFFLNTAKEIVEYRKKNNIVNKDFISLLMSMMNKEISVEIKTGRSKNPDGERIFYSQNGLTQNEIGCQAFVFFQAGFEMASTCLTFLTYELCLNQDVQDKLRNEIVDVLDKYNGEITYEAINEMTYLDQCVYEALRKHPPFIPIHRECTKTYKVPDTDLVIEKGTPVFISAWAIQHDPEHYPDPERFNPERFSKENKAKRNPYTFLSFGEGPRFCIGMRFGLLEVKVGIASILPKYKFSISPKMQVPIEYDPNEFTLTAKGGIWLNVDKI